MRKISINLNTKEITLDDLYQSFLRRCQIKNLTEKSVLSYKKRLSHFIQFYGGNTPVNNISAETVDSYILWLKDTHKAIKT